MSLKESVDLDIDKPETLDHSIYVLEKQGKEATFNQININVTSSA